MELSSKITDDATSNDITTLSYGDTVIVKYNGKIGVIVATKGIYYTVKLKNEYKN